MSIDKDVDPMEEDDYDEEADSDFDADNAPDQEASSSSDEDTPPEETSHKAHKQSSDTKPIESTSISIDLDSGDEATIKEQRKSRRKQKKKGEQIDSDSDDQGWRARTRAMREREKDEKKLSKLANLHESTIDVDKIWAEMNRPGPLPPLQTAAEPTEEPVARDVEMEQNKENIPLEAGETITIKRKYKFAGEVHVEEKVVPKSSAEARLWLSQQESKPQTHSEEHGGAVIQRPLRKISRFDPNIHNLTAFKMNLPRVGAAEDFKGPKLNVVEKSKMDWASHVDAEGLKDELDEHAKAKEGYHGRMDFLNEVEVRREEEARLARLKR